MPLNKTALSYDEVKTIMAWIDDGGKDANGKVMWAENPNRKKLYAVNQGCDVVTVFDSETQLPIRYIAVGNKNGIIDTPHQIRVSPDGAYWYVVFINNNIMQKFRCSDDTYVGDIPLTPFAAGTGVEDALDWNTFVITKDSKRAYCVSWTANGKVAAIDLENRKLNHYLVGLPNAHGIALNANEDRLYVTSQIGNYMFEIDTAFSIKNELSLENGIPWSPAPLLDPHDIILAPNNTDLVITCQRSNEVRIYNLTTNTVVKTIPTGVYPQEVVYAKKTNQYFVSCTNDTLTFPGAHGVITAIHASGYEKQNIACGFQPHGIAVDEQKSLLYVLSRNISADGVPPHHTSQCAGRNGFVNFIDLATGKVQSKTYELSVDPYFIYCRP